MPQIREYTNTKIPEGNPFESTAYSIERYGRVNQENIEKGANAASQVAATVSNHEDRMQLADWTTANSNRDRQLWDGYHAVLQDPNAPPNAAEKYLNEKVLPALDKNPLGEDQELRPNVAEKVQEVTARQKYDWTREAMTGQAKMDGERQQAAINTTVNNAAAIVGPNPAMYGAQKANVDHTIETIVPAAQQAEAKLLAHQHIAKAAAEGITSSAIAGIRGDMVSAGQLNADGIDDPNFKPVDVAQAGANRLAVARKQLEPLINDLGPDVSSQINSRLEAAGSNLDYEAQRISESITAQARQIRATQSEQRATKIQSDAVNGAIPYGEAQNRLFAPNNGIKGDDARAAMNFLDRHIADKEREAKQLKASQTAAEKQQHLQNYTNLVDTARTGILDYADALNMSVQYNLTPAESSVVMSARKLATDDKITAPAKTMMENYETEAKNIFGISSSQLQGQAPDDRSLATYTNFTGWLYQSLANQQDPMGWLTQNSKHIRDVMQSMSHGLSTGSTGVSRYQAIINGNVPRPQTPVPAAASQAPAGVDAKVWSAMTPEERAQWQTK